MATPPTFCRNQSDKLSLIINLHISKVLGCVLTTLWAVANVYELHYTTPTPHDSVDLLGMNAGKNVGSDRGWNNKN